MKEEERDPGRKLELKRCCDMLLAGGYHRARVATLSPFDKVVGGMVWSITSSGVGVDVDITFRENLRIGERIALSEKIVQALLQMKCPARIEPNQIQGLDYPMLFPVLQWLVRKVLETRRLTGDLVRQLSLSQFDKHYHLPADTYAAPAAAFVSRVSDTYAPRRIYKQKTTWTTSAATAASSGGSSLVARTEATLLEFGERLFSTDMHDDGPEREVREGMGKLAREKEDARRAKEEAQRKERQAEEVSVF
jgi:hypothetical protein